MIKRFLYTLILLFALITFFFTKDLWIAAKQLGKPSDYAYVIALQAGLIGGTLMWFQYVLGIRAFISLFTKDILGVLDVHKNIGIYGMLVVFLHPLLIILFYLSNGINLLIPKFDTTFNLSVRVGSVAFFFFLTIWLTSALLRNRLGFRAWKILHFMSYLIFPLVFIHGLKIGFTIRYTNFTAIWLFYGITFGLLTLYRIIFQFGFKKHKYEIKEIIDEANGIKRIVLKPIENFITNVIPGQFAYITIKGFYRESHPFTIANFDEDTKEITFIIKQSGKWTKNLDKFYISQTLFLDGPYGIFLQDAMQHDNLFFYAGGIGLTPFLRTTKKLLKAGKKVTFFYSVRFQNDIAYKKELDEFAKEYKNNFELIYVVADETSDPISPHRTYLGKRIDREIIYESTGDLKNSFHAICGPKPFMKAVKKILVDDGIKKEMIDMELFAY